MTIEIRQSLDYAEPLLLARRALRDFEDAATKENWLDADDCLCRAEHHLEALRAFMETKGILPNR